MKLNALKMGQKIDVNAAQKQVKAYHSFGDVAEQLVYRGVKLKAKKPGTCFISGKPIKVGDPIVWLPKTGYVALQDEVEDARQRVQQEDQDLKMMGY